MNKAEDNQHDKPHSDNSKSDSDVDMADDVINNEEATHQKHKMGQVITQKFTGLMKGIFNKAKNTVESTLHKHKDRPHADINKHKRHVEAKHANDKTSAGNTDLYKDPIASEYIQIKSADKHSSNKHSQLHNTNNAKSSKDVDISHKMSINSNSINIRQADEESKHSGKVLQNDIFVFAHKQSIFDIKRDVKPIELDDGLCRNLTADELLQLKSAQIVDQIKDIIIRQYSQRLNDDSTVHFGVKCNECKVEPIVGIRYKCSSCACWNLCDKCEVGSTHEHAFFKVKTTSTLIPTDEDVSSMIKSLPLKSDEMVYKLKPDYPTLGIDISCAIGGFGAPIKSQKDIQKANLMDVKDNHYNDRIVIQEVDAECKEHKDCLVSCKWVLENQSDETWPSSPDDVYLKSLANESLIKLPDIKLTPSDMSRLVLKPGENSELCIKFVLPHNIRQAAEKNKSLLKVAFSLFDAKSKSHYGADLLCVIPL